MTKEELAPTEPILREEIELEIRLIWKNFSLGSISLVEERNSLIRKILDPLEQSSPSLYKQLITKNENGVIPLARIRDEGIEEAIREIEPDIRSVWKNFGLGLIDLKDRDKLLGNLVDSLEQNRPFLYSQMIEEDKNGMTPLAKICEKGMKQARKKKYSRMVKSRKPKRTKTRGKKRY